MSPILVVVLQFFASLSILVMIHELGHFLMAKIFKVRVEKFYLFFNPWLTLLKFKPKNSETEYGIGWLPLGGYVKMAGMIDESLDGEQMKKEPEPWEFRTKPAWQRLLIIIMGVVFNFILAILIYSMVAFHYGDEYIPFKNVTSGMEFSELAKEIGFQDGDILLRADSMVLEKPEEASFRAILEADKVYVLRNGKEAVVDIPEDFILKVMEANTGFLASRYPFVVDSVMVGSRAERAGLMAGDSITALNDSITSISVSTCMTFFSQNKNIPVRARVSRAGRDTTLMLTPDHNGRIGVYMRPMSSYYKKEKKEYGFFESFSIGFEKGVSRLFNYAGDMKYMFTREGMQSLGGFMSIGSLFPYPFDGKLFWEMTAFLSVILAFMNILPIPALDGGHALFILYEMITKKKPSESFLMKAQMIGMMILFFLLIFANLNDVFRLFS